MISRISLHRFFLAFTAAMTVLVLVGGVWQVNEAARAAMSENAVPRPDISGDGVIEYVFSGYGMSCLRSVAGKVFPYAALVLECLLWVFFNVVALRA